MKAAIVGCGVIAARWVRALTADPRIDIAVLVDPNVSAATALAARCGLHAAHRATLHEVTSGFDLDVLVNLTPPASHAAVIRQGLLAGLHVLSEKPLTLGLTEAARLVNLATAQGRVLAVMQNHGIAPSYASFSAHVSEVAVAPLFVTAETLVPLHEAGFRSDQPFPVTSDLAVHAFDQIRALVPSAPREVVCREVALPGLAAHSAAGSVMADFADGSVFSWRGAFTTSRHHRTAATGSWRAEWPGGSATWSADVGTSISTFGAAPEIRTAAEEATTGHQVCVREMVDALHGAAANRCAASRNLASIALLEAALASAASHRPVPVETWPWAELPAPATLTRRLGEPDAR